MKLRGVYPALPTPFDENGEFDQASYLRLIEHCIEGEVSGFVPAGTTGECATLTMQEHKQLISLAVRNKKQGMLVIAGAGSNDTKKSVELAKQAQDEGADALLVVTPYYNRPTTEGLAKHIEEISKNTTLPIVLYNVPSRTGLNLNAQMLSAIKNSGRIIGIKEASGDLKQQSQMRLFCTDIILLSGDDFTFLATLAIGGAGCISVVANVMPKEVVTMQREFERGNIEAAYSIHYKLFSLIEALFCETNPGPVKELLYMMKIIKTAELRLPLVRVSEKSQKLLREVAHRLNLLA